MLFIDLLGFPDAVEQNMIEIAAGIGGFGDISLPDDQVRQITYEPPMSGFGQNLINDLVNSVPNAVVVMGVDSGFITPEGEPITNDAGITFCDGDVIRIMYDVRQCNFSGYYVFDTNGSKISLPNYILLGHELSHALHISNGDHACPHLLETLGKAAAEVMAQVDENLLRSQFGEDLRDVQNHDGGCGFASSVGSGTGIFSGCFIVSAAFGSPHAAQVDYLIRLRDVVLRRSPLGHALFANLFAEYYQFSPRVAGDMTASADLQGAIKRFVVEPLLDFLRLLEQYVCGGWQEKTFSDRVERAVRCFQGSLRESGVPEGTARRVSSAVIGLRARLEGQRSVGEVKHAHARLPADVSVEEVFSYLASVVEASSPTSEYVSWAVLDPLNTYWSTVARYDPQDSQRAGVCVSFAEAIDQWLAAVPIPSEFEHLSSADVFESLRQLSDTLFSVPAVRWVFGARLLERYEGRVPYDLRAVLERAGYAAQD